MDTQKLAAAKLWLVSTPADPASPDSPQDLPYLAHALYALITVTSHEVPRMTCDEWWRIYVNPAWLTTATVPQVGAELAHLTWHLLADHTGRARDQDVDRRTASPWGTATDITIAHTLAPDRLQPDHLPSALKLNIRPGLSAEEYYAILTRLPTAADPDTGGLEPADGCGSGADGIPRRHEHGPQEDLGAVSRFDAGEIRRKVAIDYAGHAKARGTDPGDALRWVKETLEPTVAWEPLLAGAVRRAVGWASGRGDWTYTRPSRRASALPGVVLPGQHRPVPRISIVIDTSASVDDELLARALGEVDAALLALGVPGSSINVYSVDAAVHTAQEVRRARDAKLVGAGGTDLRAGLAAIEQERPRPDVVIALTDGDTPWPAAPPPGAVVIAALLGRDRAGLPPTPIWATRVECLVDYRGGRYSP